MANSPTKHNGFYYPQIDTLRFFAFVVVFLGHVNLKFMPSFFVGTAWFGVQFFFLLSGFLLTRILYLEFKNTGSLNFKNYFIRRILRVWPLYYAYIAGVIVLAIIMNQQFSYLRILGNAFFIDNILTILGWRNGNAGTGILWTISVEEQYYLVLPFIIFWVSVKPYKRIFLLFCFCTTFLFISRLIAIYFEFSYHSIYFSPLSSDCFLAGVFTGLLYKESVFQKWKSITMLILGIVILVFARFLSSKQHVGWNQMSLYPLLAIGFLLILISVLNSNSLHIKAFFTNRILCFLGKISFGMYIFHHIIIKIIGDLFNNYGTLLQLLGLILMFIITVLAATLSFFLFEKKFLNMKKKFQVISSGS